MKSVLFCIFLSIVWAIQTFASERVIVVMKDEKSFALAAEAVRRGDVSLWQRAHFAQESLRHVEASLKYLNSFIILAHTDFEIETLRSHPQVKIVEREIFHPLPELRVSDSAVFLKSQGRDFPGPRTPWGIKAVKAPEAWASAHQGQGARVLVLDTGIDKDHPSIKDNFEQGRDFTGRSGGDDFSDLVGHGTHVSGTIAGALDPTGFVGVAPQAKLLMGRVCSTLGCSSAAIVSGINWGIAQKVDVISMSLGGPWATATEKEAVQKADAAGLSVVAASGNDGSNQVSYPAALPTAIAVGAVDSSLKKADFSQYGPELAVVAPGVAVLSSVPRGTGREAAVFVDEGQGSVKVQATSFQGARDVFTPETNTLILAGLGKPDDFVGKDVKGHFALVARGDILFSEKAKNAAAAGAVGIVIYNNTAGLIEGALTADGSTLPIAAFMIEQDVGLRIVNRLNSGGSVRATVQTIATDYMEFQGTSMATPHVVGVVALMKAANSHLNPAQVKNILKETAQTLGPNNQNQYGSGMVNAESAVNAALQAK